MNTEGYVAFLLLGVVLITVDGQVLFQSGRRYLLSAYRDEGSAASVGRLVTMFYYLVMLGVLALVSAVDVPAANGPLPAVVTRIGILLLILAVGHGVTTWVLAGLRRRQENQRLSEKLTDQFDRDRVVTIDRDTSSAGSQGDVHTTISTSVPDKPIYTPSDQPYVAPAPPGVLSDNPPE